MTSFLQTRTYPAPSLCRREILRYAGCREETPQLQALLDECLSEALPLLSYKICWRILPVRIQENTCDFGVFSVSSEGLSKNLRDSTQVILMAATVGTQLDRLISKYGRLAPAKALLLQAVGAERIEALCDTFCRDMARETGLSLRPRFSPGYGDLPLEFQKDIFDLLDCPKQIGLSLNDSLLMSPSKSVTAFAGLTERAVKETGNKCSACPQADCQFRGAL